MSGQVWRRSSACNFGECVEVSSLPNGAVAVRSSTDPGVQVVFTADEWWAFATGVRAGEFDLEEATPDVPAQNRGGA